MATLAERFAKMVEGLSAEIGNMEAAAGGSLVQQIGELAALAGLVGTEYQQGDGQSAWYAALFLPDESYIHPAISLGPTQKASLTVFASRMDLMLKAGKAGDEAKFGPMWIRIESDSGASGISSADPAGPQARPFCVTGSFWIDFAPGKGVELADVDLAVPPFQLGSTGVILSSGKVTAHVFLGTIPVPWDAIKLGSGFRGLLFADVKAALPPTLTFAGFDTLTAPIAAIGTGGFTGKFAAENSTLANGALPEFNPTTGTYDCKGAGKILGFAAAVRKISLAFQCSALTASEVTAVLRLPGFDVDVEANAFLSLD